MKGVFLRTLVAGAMLFGLAGMANAVTYTGTESITSTGQGFNFHISPAEVATGSGLFSIRANGDYTLSYSYLEGLNWNINGVVSGGPWGPDNADSVTQFSYDDNEWTKSITFDASTMALLTAGGSLDINIQNLNDVNDFNSSNPDFVSYSLTYNGNSAPVPEPGTMMLLGIGMAGLAIYGKRRASSK